MVALGLTIWRGLEASVFSNSLGTRALTDLQIRWRPLSRQSACLTRSGLNLGPVMGISASSPK